MHDIELVAQAVRRLEDAEPLQEHHRLVGVLAVERARQVHRTDGAGLRGQVPFGQGPLQRLAVEQHGHREPQAQLLDTRAQVGQVDAVKVHAGAVDRLALPVPARQ
jgi:hypothetical protein